VSDEQSEEREELVPTGEIRFSTKELITILGLIELVESEWQYLEPQDRDLQLKIEQHLGL
jgi:hypothetical protein